MRFVAEIQSSFHICARVGDIDAARAYIIKIGNQSRKCTHRARWRETGRVSYRVHESVQMISRANGSVEVETHKITGWRAYAITQTRVRARVCLNSSFFFREKGNKIWSWRFRDTKFPAWTQRYRATDSLPPNSTYSINYSILHSIYKWCASFIADHIVKPMWLMQGIRVNLEQGAFRKSIGISFRRPKRAYRTIAGNFRWRTSGDFERNPAVHIVYRRRPR